MKDLRKLFGIIFVAAIIVCAMAACEFFDLPQTNQTPVAGDYDIGNLTQPVGNVTAVTITPKSGKSTGKITIYYEGTGSTTYAKSTTRPTTGTSGSTYAVTFDVAAATGWNAVSGLYAGTLTIGILTPVAGDYEFSGLAQTYGKVTAVTITPKADKSTGKITINYEGTSGTTYAKSITLPTAKGTYAVTFDVAAASGWNAAIGLSAGNLVINDNQTPVASDYDIGNLTQSVGSVTAVTITPKADKSSGARTIYYEGTGSTTYAKSTTRPTTGTSGSTYAVTFDVAAATGWNAATGLSAGTLVLNTNQTPDAGDYVIDNLTQSVGNVTAVTITPKSGKSLGAITIYYEGTGSTTYAKSATLPTTAGAYAVTFDVAAASGWNAATGLSAGNLVINPATVPVTGVSLNKSSLSLVVGGTETLIATVTPGNATNRNVTWSTSKSAIATVSNGKVSAKSSGTATITVTTTDGTITASCSVMVIAGSGTVPAILAGTWKAEQSGTELEVWGDIGGNTEYWEHSFNNTYILTFTTASDWRIDMNFSITDSYWTNDTEFIHIENEGGEDSANGIYTVSGSTIVLASPDNGNSLEGRIDGDTIVFYSNDEDLIFVKQ